MGLCILVRLSAHGSCTHVRRFMCSVLAKVRVHCELAETRCKNFVLPKGR